MADDRSIPHRLAPIVLDADGVPVIDTAYQRKLVAVRLTEPGGALVTPTSKALRAASITDTEGRMK